MYARLQNFLKNNNDIDEKSLAKIVLCFGLLKTKRNEILLSYNQVCSHYYFINKGCVRLYTTSKDGNETSRYFAFEGSFVTALPSFIDQRPAEEYLQTIEKSELLFISRTNFYKLVTEVPQFARLYTQILELGFIVAQKRIYGFQGFDALDKVKWVIEHQPELLRRLSNKMMASYLGIAPATLSRLKSKL